MIEPTKIPKNKSNIFLHILQAIFLNFEENNNGDIIIKFIYEILKLPSNNYPNFVSLYDIFFVENKELTANIFFYLQKNCNKYNLNIKNFFLFIEKNLLENLLINKKESFLYPFTLKCLKEGYFEEAMELLRKIILSMGKRNLNENLKYNYIRIIKLFEKYLNLLTNKIPYEDFFISIIENLFIEIENQNHIC